MESTSCLNVGELGKLTESRVREMLEKFVNENATVMTEYTFKTVETEGD